MVTLVFFSRVLLCLKTLLMIGFSVLKLYVKNKKGMPQAVKSIRLRNRGCSLIMQKEIVLQWNRQIGLFPLTLHEWLVEL